MDVKKLQGIDPVKKQAEKGLESVEHTPLNPPDAYSVSSVKGISYEELPAALQQLMDEHKAGMIKIDAFEKALVNFKEAGFKINHDINQAFNDFFTYFDNQMQLHNEKEEKVLFPILHKKLIEVGEHSIGEHPMTAIDVMEDDHMKFVQLGALTFNLLGLAPRIQHPQDRNFVFDAAYNTGRELIELLKLHIYREDVTLFPLAAKLLSPEVCAEIQHGFKKYIYKEEKHQNCSSC